jgi:hypothetical protein
MKVTACIATRGNVDMEPILDSLPAKWQRVVWNNGDEMVWLQNQHGAAWTFHPVSDLGPHGRFAAIDHAAHDVVYVQDDDVIVSDPQQIVDEWLDLLHNHNRDDVVVANMPAEFRPHYPDSIMVGFGACFHRDAPETAFAKFFDFHTTMTRTDPLFLRESCRIFSILTPQYLVDVLKTDMPYASDPDRLWKQPGHIQSRDKALMLAREARDA